MIADKIFGERCVDEHKRTAETCAPAIKQIAHPQRSAAPSFRRIFGLRSVALWPSDYLVKPFASDAKGFAIAAQHGGNID